jgi:hypothetical protein
MSLGQTNGLPIVLRRSKRFTMKKNIFNLVAVCAATLALSGTPAIAADANATAFELVKEGNRHLGVEARDRVVQIRSEKSVGTLTPNIWYIVYYDPDATAKAAEIKFVAGEKVSVKRPARILEFFGSSNKELPKEKLKIDSDKALAIAKKEPILKNLTLTSSRLTLERWDSEPVWKVRFWAAKLRDSSRTADIGEVFVSSETGDVVKNDLHINRVD